MNGYANALRKQGIEPLHHQISIQDDMGNAHTFQIESILYYTNYEDGYVNHKNEDAIKDYQILPPAVGIVKQETLQNLRNEIIKAKGEGATGAFSTMLKVRFDSYDMQDEYEFRQDALDTYYMSSADFRLLADELNGNRVQDAIFRFVSMSVTACLLLSCLFVLYAFLKRKLLDDQEKLSILVINGITKRNIQRAYDLEYGRLFVFAILYLILFDFFTYLVLQQQSDYILRLLFTMSWETAKWLLPLLVAFIIVLMLMIRWQVHRCFHGNLSTNQRKTSVGKTETTCHQLSLSATAYGNATISDRSIYGNTEYLLFSRYFLNDPAFVHDARNLITFVYTGYLWLTI